MQVLKQLLDAHKELGEAIREAEEAAAEEAAGGGKHEAAAGDDADSEDSEMGFGFDQEAFSPAQLAVARRAQALLAAVGGMVRAVAKLLLAER